MKWVPILVVEFADAVATAAAGGGGVMVVSRGRGGEDCMVRSGGGDGDDGRLKHIQENELRGERRMVVINK